MNDAHRYDAKAVWSWAIYDFANSAFTTLITTFIYATYFTNAIAPNVTRGTSLWGDTLTISAILVAVLSPIVGAIADRGRLRKASLLVATIIAITCAAALYFPLPGQVLPALLLFGIGNTAFELSYVFYNAFLPDLAPPDRIGRVSGWGWGLGYIGGLACLVVALFGFVMTDTPLFGFSKDAGENIRATNLLVAVWFGLFSLPLFAFVREERLANRPGLLVLARQAVGELSRTFHEVRHYRQILRLLVAHLVYNDGLITIFAFGGIYASGTFGFSTQDVILFGIVLNLMAGLGAFAFGFLDDRIGGRATVMISLVGLFGAGLLAVLTRSLALFWVAAILVGILSGPNQAASRSLLARFVPESKQNEFFGFFSLSGKFTAFMGPFLLSRMTSLFESQRAGIAVVLVFFLVGALLLARVNEQEGIAVAQSER